MYCVPNNSSTPIAGPSARESLPQLRETWVRICGIACRSRKLRNSARSRTLLQRIVCGGSMSVCGQCGGGGVR